MAEFVEVAQLEQLAPGRSLFVHVGETGVALFNIEGKICAINDTCLHQGSSLAQGKLDGNIVTCRAHGWKYDVTTGRLKLNPGRGVDSYPVEIADGKIKVAVTPEREPPTGDRDGQHRGDTGINPWGDALRKLEEWDPEGAALVLQVGTDPWTSGVFSRREVELISVAVNCACTNLDEAATRRHIRAALEAGATRDEILTLLKMGFGLAVHSCSLGAPILLEEMKAAGVEPAGGEKPPTPACDAMRAMGQWNTAWDPFYELSPRWTDRFFALGASLYAGGVFTPKFVELLSIAFDASVTHMYAPGTRRHIKAALATGATAQEIMTVLQVCVSMGVASCAKGVPILAEELERSARQPQP